MKFDKPLIKGRLVRRYKRFLADVRLDDGSLITAHTANPGGMLGLTRAGSRVLLSHHDNPKRKLAYSWELLRIGHHWVSVNPIRSNAVVAEAIANGAIAPLRGYPQLCREVAFGERGSRVDLLLTDGDRRCYVEVKTATLVEGGRAMFPDAVTERGRKHLLELESVVRAGHRGVIFFFAARGDVQSFSPADAIDPAYGKALREAARHGVELLAYGAKVGPRNVSVAECLQIDLPRWLEPSPSGE